MYWHVASEDCSKEALSSTPSTNKHRIANERSLSRNVPELVLDALVIPPLEIVLGVVGCLRLEEHVVEWIVAML
jgi:hypothetical protein